MKHTKIQNALKTYADFLAEKPTWIGVVQYNTSESAVLDQFDFFWSTDDSSHYNKQSEIANELLRKTQDSLDTLGFGNIQSVCFHSGTGILILVNLLDHICIAVSYIGIGVRSIEAVLETVENGTQIIADAYYLD